MTHMSLNTFCFVNRVIILFKVSITLYGLNILKCIFPSSKPDLFKPLLKLLVISQIATSIKYHIVKLLIWGINADYEIILMDSAER